MAPVGSYDSLTAAINAGADAVYFGVEGLNMRSRSSANFTLHDLRIIVELCHKAGVKTYLTVNTIVYDNDLAHVDSSVSFSPLPLAKEDSINKISPPTAVQASPVATPGITPVS